MTNAPATELALQLYGITHSAQYLQFAEMDFNWVRTCLLQANDLYADHIGNHGAVEKTYWSYNQGSMIGAATMLYQATGNAQYFNDARQTAAAAIAYFTPKRLEEEIPFFPSVYFRNLLYLDALTHESTATRLAQEYVNHAWERLRLPTTRSSMARRPAASCSCRPGSCRSTRCSPRRRARTSDARRPRARAR